MKKRFRISSINLKSIVTLTIMVGFVFSGVILNANNQHEDEDMQTFGGSGRAVTSLSGFSGDGYLTFMDVETQQPVPGIKYNIAGKDYLSNRSSQKYGNSRGSTNTLRIDEIPEGYYIPDFRRSTCTASEHYLYYTVPIVKIGETYSDPSGVVVKVIDSFGNVIPGASISGSGGSIGSYVNVGNVPGMPGSMTIHTTSMYATVVVKTVDNMLTIGSRVNGTSLLDGNTYEIQNGSGDTMQTDIGTLNGNFSIDGVPPGTYKIIEKATHIDYLLKDENDRTQTINLGANDKTVLTFDHTDRPRAGDIVLDNIDEANGNKISSGKWELLDSNDSVIDTIDFSELTSYTRNLPIGDYKLKQKEKAVGYYSITDAKNFSITDLNTVNVNIENRKIIKSVEINAKLSDTFNLDGATLELRNSRDEVIQGGLNYVNNKIVINGLEEGNYKIIETSLPIHIAENLRNQNIEIRETNGDVTTVDFNYSLKPINVDIKLKGSDNKPLENTEFEVNGKVVKTNAEGIARVENLKDGTFTITQLNNVDGYEKSEPKQISLAYSKLENEIEFVNQLTDYNLVVTLKDNLTKEPIANTKFEVLSNNIVLDVLTTDAEGKLTKVLNKGDYTIRQKNKVDGYEIDTVAKDVSFSGVSNTKTVNILNVKTNYKLEVSLVDSDNNKKLTEGKFQIHKDSELIGEYNVDSEGFFEVTLTKGNYVLTQIEKLDGYEINRNSFAITFAGESVTKDLTVTNAKTVYNTTVNLVDKDTKEPIANSKFNIREQDLNFFERLFNKPKEYTTDSNGTFTETFNKGKYEVVQTETIDGYQLNDKVIKFEFKGETRNESIEIQNTKTDYTVELVLVDAENGEVIPGSEFELYKNKNIVETLTTDSRGSISKVLNKGKYSLKQIGTPDGYDLNETEIEFEFKGGPKTTELKHKNVKTKYTLGITLKDKDNPEILIDNSKFKISGDNQQITTNSRGYAEVVLTIGDYTVTQISSEDGYDKTSEEFNVEFNGAGHTENLEVFNKKTDYEVELLLKDAEDEEVLIPGGVYELRKDNDVIEELVTDDEGKFTTILNKGDYNLKQVESKDGYNISEEIITLELNGSARKENLEDLNNKTTYKLNVELTDRETKEQIEGAEFGLYAKEELVEKFQTDSKGSYSKDLTIGEYTVKQLEKIDGYEIEPESKTIDFKGESREDSLKFTNDKTVYNIKVNLKDKDTEEVIPESEFVLLDSKNKEVSKAKTDKEGSIKFEVNKGSYKIKQLNVNKTYGIDTNEYDLEFKGEAEEQVLDVKNEKLIYKINIMVKDRKTKEPLPGAEFNLLNSKSEIIEVMTSDKEGKLSASVNYGEYSIQQISAPEGYTLDNNVYKLDMENPDKEIELEIFNELDVHTLSVISKDKDTGKVIGSLKLKIRNEDNNKLFSIKTDDKGETNIKLETGKYKITQANTLKGYDENKEVYSISMDKDNELVVENTKTVFIVPPKVEPPKIEPPKIVLPQTGGVYAGIGSALVIAFGSYRLYKRKDK